MRRRVQIVRIEMAIACSGTRDRRKSCTAAATSVATITAAATNATTVSAQTQCNYFHRRATNGTRTPRALFYITLENGS